MKTSLNFSPIVVFLSTLIVTWSCETIIDVDLPRHKPAIVLNSFFGTDTTFQVTLHQSKDILDGSYDFKIISGAQVELYKDDQLIGTLTESDPGYYTLLDYPEPGGSYSIKASKSGFESVEATDVVPNRTANLSLDKIEEKTNEYNDPVFHLTYSIDDQPGADFYEVLLYMYYPRYDYYQDEDTAYQYLVGYYKELMYYNEVGAELNEFEDVGNPGVFSDELFDGKKHSNTIEIYYYYYDEGQGSEDDHTVDFTLEVRHLSEAMYLYKSSLQLQTDTRDNPFAEVAHVFNNISQGYGIFAGYHTESVDFEYKYK